MHLDKANNQLAVGDEVAFSVSDRSTRLGFGIIEAFTATRVRVRVNGRLSSHQPDRIIKVIREG